MGNWVVAHSREGTWGLEILRYGPTMRKDCILPRFLLPYNHQATTHRDQPAKSLRDKPGLIQTWSLHTWGVGIPPWGRGIPQWRGGIQSWHLLPTGPGFYQAWNQEILWGQPDIISTTLEPLTYHKPVSSWSILAEYSRGQAHNRSPSILLPTRGSRIPPNHPTLNCQLPQ